MKQAIILIILCGLGCMTAQAQRIGVHQHGLSDSTATASPMETELKRHLFNAGDELQQSASFEFIGCLLGATSFLSYSQATGDNADSFKAIGTVCAVLAVASEVVALTFRRKGGIELKVAANSVSITF